MKITTEYYAIYAGYGRFVNDAKVTNCSIHVSVVIIMKDVISGFPAQIFDCLSNCPIAIVVLHLQGPIKIEILMIISRVIQHSHPIGKQSHEKIGRILQHSI